MEPCRNIKHLPPEIRCKIWASAGRDERYQSLLGTSRTIRSDVLSLIPGVGISCQCPFNRPCECGNAIEVKRLVITVESDVVRPWLKFSVTMTHSQGPSWTIDSLDDPMAKSLQHWYRRYDDPKYKIRQLEKRNRFLYFYEMIMTPFALHWAWRSARVTFDRDHKKKSTSFTSLVTIAGQIIKTYHGFKALHLTVWAYSEQLMTDGQMERPEENPIPEFEDYESISAEWTAQDSHHETWRKALEYYLNFTIATSEDFIRIIHSVIWHRVDELLFKLRSKRSSPSCNGFSVHNPGSDIEAGYQGSETGHWTWNHDIIRRRYRAWCNNWYYDNDVSVMSSSEDDGWDSDPSEIIGVDDGWGSNSDDSVGFEEFEPAFLRFQRPLNWNWKSQDRWIGRVFEV
ncbi:hypothetical protein TARUN_4811 [Trichoderma arundinaceum]|uniref:Uncharacterized protein n=1 Tax=Trichoderma arundinaceum TaxID=490622 RepID=A0A395NNA1_TRIAR|nr:hypothetical protein TARUN_4811 [Trichoderma arundinaceum]